MVGPSSRCRPCGRACITCASSRAETEVDLLAELAGGGLVAVEVKADAAPSPDAARHLATLRDLYSTFVAGIVLHSGPRTYRLGGRIVAAPISSLWG